VSFTKPFGAGLRASAYVFDELSFSKADRVIFRTSILIDRHVPEMA
jgi:hypothetical protein